MVADRTSLAGTPPAPDTDDVYAEPSPAGLDDAVEKQSPERMRELLPALERERRITDWGRSERIEGHVRRERRGDEPFDL